MEDWQLLQDYAETRSESAFRALVRRHLGLVHAAALRQLNDPALAQDVAQADFILLARKAPRLTGKGPLPGWLFQTTRFVAARAGRSELRRQRREQEAMNMQELLQPDEAWRRIAPELDEGLAQLGRTERDAVLLRFFEDKNHEQVGAALGISEEAAKKRTSRALEKLRGFFARRGFVVSSTLIASSMGANAAPAAPAALEAAIVSGTMAGGSAAISTLPTLVRGTLEAWRAAQWKLAGWLGTASLGLGLAINAVLPNVPSPDPVALLRTVAEARQRITSGELEMEVQRYELAHPLDGTNRIRVKALFEGEKHRRFQSFQRAYTCVLTGPEAGKVTDAKRKELRLDQVAAVQAGLLTPFDQENITIFDGTNFLDYEIIVGQSLGRTSIDYATNSNTPNLVFDPRCLGLWTWLTPDRTIENCLQYATAKSVALAGKETVNGIDAWHVVLRSNWDETLHYWIDAARPQRLLQHARGRSTATSKYDPEHPEDLLPVEVAIIDYSTPSDSGLSEHFVRRQARFNVPIAPVSWTLAGLNMPIGTSIDDLTSGTRSGFWNGTGVSKAPVPGAYQGSTPKPPPNATPMMELLEKDQKSPFAVEAATWVLLKTPRGPHSERALEIILREHLQSSNLVTLCVGSPILPRADAIGLLQSILASNQVAAVQAHVCLALANRFKEMASESGDARLSQQAGELLQRFVRDYGDVPFQEKRIGDQAGAELAELNRFGIGQAAPEIEAEDLDGQVMRLSDYRGKVVVLTFWGTWCAPCMAMVPDERKLVERLAGKPFALLGVNSDKHDAKLAEAIKKAQITWPSFRDGDRGRIAKAWNVRNWPATYVLDPNGVIRYRNLRGKALEEAVDNLLRE